MNSFLRTVALVAFVFVGISGDAWAQAKQCPSPSLGDGDQFFNMANLAMPTADERTAVEDFISRYAWLMDNRRKDAVGALFAGDGTYLLCQLGVAESEVNAVGKDVAEELDASFKKLEAEKKRARRLFGNILIRKNISDGTFEVLISSVVFTQVIATQAPPEVDYMATLYATIAEDPFGTGLKFRSLTVVTDPQGIQIRAR